MIMMYIMDFNGMVFVDLAWRLDGAFVILVRPR